MTTKKKKLSKIGAKKKIKTPHNREKNRRLKLSRYTTRSREPRNERGRTRTKGAKLHNELQVQASGGRCRPQRRARNENTLGEEVAYVPPLELKSRVCSRSRFRSTP